MAKQDESAAAALRSLPSVDALLKDAALENCAADVGRKSVVDSIRQAIDRVRAQIASGSAAELDVTPRRKKLSA